MASSSSSVRVHAHFGASARLKSEAVLPTQRLRTLGIGRPSLRPSLRRTLKFAPSHYRLARHEAGGGRIRQPVLRDEARVRTAQYPGLQQQLVLGAARQPAWAAHNNNTQPLASAWGRGGVELLSGSVIIKQSFQYASRRRGRNWRAPQPLESAWPRTAVTPTS